MAPNLAIGPLLWAASAMAQPYAEGFEGGMGGARSYFEAPHGAPLTLGTDNPAEGKQHIRCVLPGRSRLVVSDGTTTLVCVLNETGQPAAHTRVLPAEAGSGREFYTGQAVAAGATVALTLEPGQVRVYVLRKA